MFCFFNVLVGSAAHQHITGNTAPRLYFKDLGIKETENGYCVGMNVNC